MKKIFLLLLTFLFHSFIFGQSGTLDVSFNDGSGIDGDLQAVASQNDKILIGGMFSSYNGISVEGFARLNSDGSLDQSFASTSFTGGWVSDIIVQPDGKIFIGGAFAGYNGEFRPGVAKLNSDGSLDDSFIPSGNEHYHVYCMALQSDGKIILGGDFEDQDGNYTGSIRRLNPDGSIDQTFNVGTGFTYLGSYSLVKSLAVQPDGKILAGGQFTEFNGVSRNYIARLNSDGTLDAEFNVGTGTDWEVWSIAIQSDSKIIFGGNFEDYNGTAVNSLVRVNYDGSIDPAFTTGAFQANDILKIVINKDGNIIVGGRFNDFNGVTRNNIVRLNSNGSVDMNFDPGTGVTGPDWVEVADIAMQADGKLVLAGIFSEYNGVSRTNVVRIYDEDIISSISSGISLFSLMIYPNPARDHVVLKSASLDPGLFEVTVYNQLGQLVLKTAEVSSSGSILLDVATLQAGLYSLQVVSNGKIFNQNLVKK